MKRRAPRMQRHERVTSAQLVLPFSQQRAVSTPLERELLARAFVRVAAEEDDAEIGAGLEAAAERLLGRKPH